MRINVITVEGLKREIRDLQGALAQNNFELNRERRAGRTNRLPDLLLARVEIFMSISHRQGMIIEVLQNEIRFERKVA